MPICVTLYFFFFKQKTAYELRISDWSSDVCSSDLQVVRAARWRPGLSEVPRLLIGQVPLGADPEMLFRRFDVHPVELGDHVVDVGRGHIGIGSVRHFMLRVIHGSLRPIERAPSQPWEIAGPFCRDRKSTRLNSSP